MADKMYLTKPCLCRFICKLTLKLTIAIQTTTQTPTLQSTEMTMPPDDRNMDCSLERAQKCSRVQLENGIATHHDSNIIRFFTFVW
jgi:hypothetical protein